MIDLRVFIAPEELADAVQLLSAAAQPVWA
jgi:hypothetical protein